jgi:arylformamidase
VHRTLLAAGIAVLEGIRLDGVPCGTHFLFAAPLLLGGLDGAPVRAVLMDP